LWILWYLNIVNQLVIEYNKSKRWIIKIY